MTEHVLMIGDYQIVPRAIIMVPSHPLTPDSGDSEQVTEWSTKHRTMGEEFTIAKRRWDGVEYQEPLRHWHRESLVQKMREQLHIKEYEMEFHVLMTTAKTTAVVAGPYDEVDANYHRKRLAEQHPESVFTIEAVKDASAV